MTDKKGLNPNRLNGKDLINAGIFSAIYVVIIIAVACTLGLIPIGFLLITVVVPLWAMLQYDDSAPLWREILSDDYYRNRLIWTIFQAACTSILAIVLALPMGWALARLQFIGRNWLIKLMMLPFIMPTLVAGMGVLALFGEHGIV